MEHSYEILNLIGRGTHGSVYRAKYVGEGGFSKVVALKMLDLNVDEGDEVATRLRDEARLLGILDHPAIVHVDRLARLDGRWTVVMEHIDGANLKSLIDQSPLPFGPALEIIGQVADALHAAYHKVAQDGSPLKLQHRDIKPSNILVTRYGTVKVLDFGIARAEFVGRETLTRSFVMGSAEYTAPERLALEDGGPWSDIYTLGQVLYALLLGRDFGRTHPSEVQHRALLDDGLNELLDMRGGVDDELISLLLGMLALEPANRPKAMQVVERCGALCARLGRESLRAWSGRVVVPMLAKAQANKTEGLCGRTLAEEGSGGIAGPVRPADPSDLSRLFRGSEPAPAPAPAASPRRAPLHPALLAEALAASDADVDSDPTEVMHVDDMKRARQAAEERSAPARSRAPLSEGLGSLPIITDTVVDPDDETTVMTRPRPAEKPDAEGAREPAAPTPQEQEEALEPTQIVSADPVGAPPLLDDERDTWEPTRTTGPLPEPEPEEPPADLGSQLTVPLPYGEETEVHDPAPSAAPEADADRPTEVEDLQPPADPEPPTKLSVEDPPTPPEPRAALQPEGPDELPPPTTKPIAQTSGGWMADEPEGEAAADEPQQDEPQQDEPQREWDAEPAEPQAQEGEPENGEPEEGEPPEGWPVPVAPAAPDLVELSGDQPWTDQGQLDDLPPAPSAPEPAPAQQEPAPAEQEPAPPEQEPAPAEQEPAPAEPEPAPPEREPTPPQPEPPAEPAPADPPAPYEDQSTVAAPPEPPAPYQDRSTVVTPPSPPAPPAPEPPPDVPVVDQSNIPKAPPPPPPPAPHAEPPPPPPQPHPQRTLWLWVLLLLFLLSVVGFVLVTALGGAAFFILG